MAQLAFHGLHKSFAVLVKKTAGKAFVQHVLKKSALVGSTLQRFQFFLKQRGTGGCQFRNQRITAQPLLIIGTPHIRQHHAALQGEQKFLSSRLLKHGLQKVKVVLRLPERTGTVLFLPSQAQPDHVSVRRNHLIQRPVLHFQHDKTVFRRIEHEIGRLTIQRRIDPRREEHGKLFQKTVKTPFTLGGILRKGSGNHGGHKHSVRRLSLRPDTTGGSCAHPCAHGMPAGMIRQEISREEP